MVSPDLALETSLYQRISKRRHFQIIWAGLSIYFIIYLFHECAPDWFCSESTHFSFSFNIWFCCLLYRMEQSVLKCLKNLKLLFQDCWGAENCLASVEIKKKKKKILEMLVSCGQTLFLIFLFSLFLISILKMSGEARLRCWHHALTSKADLRGGGGNLELENVLHSF